MSAPQRHGTLHGWSVDVEDWFHILDCGDGGAQPDWDRRERRVHIGTGRMLDLLDRYGHKATFFTLGWVADRYPELLVRICERGHEIGSHGHMHRMVSDMSPDAFARDLDLSLEAIHRACGRAARCFRAPGFSIGRAQTWALPILADRGIEMDASFFLAPHAHGGFDLRREGPFELHLPGGRTMLEVPVVPLLLPRGALPWSGGGYLRLLPAGLLRELFAASDRRGRGAVGYIHPRELDPYQPRMALPPLRRLRYYVGLRSVPGKLDLLMARFRFGTLSEMAAAAQLDRPLQVELPR